jgi:hypothetical protein
MPKAPKSTHPEIQSSSRLESVSPLTLAELHDLNYTLRSLAVMGPENDELAAVALSIGPRLQRWLLDHNVNLTDEEATNTPQSGRAETPLAPAEPLNYAQDDR